MEQTIFTPSGNKYITMKYDEDRGIVRLQLHSYDPEKIYVNIDCKAIPQLMSFLDLVRSK